MGCARELSPAGLVGERELQKTLRGLDGTVEKTVEQLSARKSRVQGPPRGPGAAVEGDCHTSLTPHRALLARLSAATKNEEQAEE